MMYHKDYVYQLKRTAPKENGVVCCFHRRDGEVAGCEIYAAERQGRLREKKEGGDSVALPSHECRQEIEKDIPESVKLIFQNKLARSLRQNLCELYTKV